MISRLRFKKTAQGRFLPYLLTPAIAIGTEKLEKAIQKILLRKQHKKTFIEMQEIYPELKEMPETEVKNYFDTITQYAPNFATNPTVTGSLVKQMVNMKGTIPERLFSLIEAESRIQKEKTFPSEVMREVLMKSVPTYHVERPSEYEEEDS